MPPCGAPPPMSERYDVAVIGAGVMGATTALFLARGGMKVAAARSRRDLPRGLRSERRHADAAHDARRADPLCAGRLADVDDRRRNGSAPASTRLRRRACRSPSPTPRSRSWNGARRCAASMAPTSASSTRSAPSNRARVESATAEGGLVRNRRLCIRLPDRTRLSARAGRRRASRSSKQRRVVGIDARRSRIHRSGRRRRRAGWRRASSSPAASGSAQMLAWLGVDIAVKCLINQLIVTERMRPVMRTVLSVASGLLSLKQFAQRHGADRRRLAGSGRSGARRRRNAARQPDRQPAAGALDRPGAGRGAHRAHLAGTRGGDGGRDAAPRHRSPACATPTSSAARTPATPADPTWASCSPSTCSAASPHTRCSTRPASSACRCPTESMESLDGPFPTPIASTASTPPRSARCAATARIDEAALASAPRRRGVATDGIVGVLINGHAGENFMLSRAEKKRVVEIAQADDRRAGDPGLRHQRGELARGRRPRPRCGSRRRRRAAGVSAVFLGAVAGRHDGAQSPPPRRRRLEAAADALPGGRRHAALAYNAATCWPRWCSCPNVVGIKEGSWESARYEANRRLVRAVAPQVAVMASGDEHLLTCMAIGSEGSLVSLAVLVPDLIVALDRAIAASDLATARSVERPHLPAGHGDLRHRARRPRQRPPQGLPEAPRPARPARDAPTDRTAARRGNREAGSGAGRRRPAARASIAGSRTDAAPSNAIRSPAMTATLIRNGRIVTAVDDYTRRRPAGPWPHRRHRRSACTSARTPASSTPAASSCFPGGVDCHTHMENTFGDSTTCDTFESGTRSAAFGGTTTIVDFAFQRKDDERAGGHRARRRPRRRTPRPSTTASTSSPRTSTTARSPTCGTRSATRA